jgi:hypothetical protein
MVLTGAVFLRLALLLEDKIALRNLKAILCGVVADCALSRLP